MAGNVAELIDAVGTTAAVVVVANGAVCRLEVDADLAGRGLRVGTAGDLGLDAADADVVGTGDVFSRLNHDLATDAIVVDVPRGMTVPHPVVVVHWVDQDGIAVFPRLLVRTGELAEVTVLEAIASADVDALVVPVAGLAGGPGSHLHYLGVQELGPRVWQVGRQGSLVDRDATVTSALVALGGHYARVHTHSRLAGTGASSDQLAVYFGDGQQMHDFRTTQDHASPRTTSELLFKGAVEDEARGVYTGLIDVQPGAKGSLAFQTNRNLILSEGAHVESVPNLEMVNENEIKCSHASATGPIEEDQRYYLEARGVPREVADRLIILGFFGEIIDRTPVAGLRPHLRDAVAAKLQALHADG